MLQYMGTWLGGGKGGGVPGRTGLGRWKKKEREAGVFRGWEVGDHVDKTLKKYNQMLIFNIIMLFDLHIASKYTNDTNVLAKNLPLINSP